jgi:hypothetical protein
VLLAALHNWLGALEDFFHLNDLIFVILRKWVLNVICQEAKQLCYFLSGLEFYSNNSTYQKKRPIGKKKFSKLSCRRFECHLTLQKKPVAIGVRNVFTVSKWDYVKTKCHQCGSLQHKRSGHKLCLTEGTFKEEDRKNNSGTSARFELLDNLRFRNLMPLRMSTRGGWCNYFSA